MLEATNKKISIRRQSDLLNINRSSYYYQPNEVTQEDVCLMNEIHDIWQTYSFYGYRRITKELKERGYQINRKKVQRLMKLIGIQAIFPKPRTSIKNYTQSVYPYLLQDLSVTYPNQVWMVDITYLKLGKGFIYLVALIDVYSRFIVSWHVSNTLDADFCIEALQTGLKQRKPEIVNSDQGCQFTSEAWVNCLKEADVKISMTGRGRCLDNIYIERFWRSLKYEAIYLNEYDSVKELKRAITDYIRFYNHKRFHQSLAYKRPAEVYFKEEKPVDMCTNLLASSQVLHTYPQAQS